MQAARYKHGGRNGERSRRVASSRREVPLSVSALAVPPADAGEDHDEHQEWRNALGNLDKLTITILGPGTTPGTAKVRVDLEDPYQWHPGDERVTQCIHEYFEPLKPVASEYMAIDTGEVDLPLDKAMIPTRRVTTTPAPAPVSTGVSSTTGAGSDE